MPLDTIMLKDAQMFKSVWNLYMKQKHVLCIQIDSYYYAKLLWDFPGGAVVKNPPANAVDMGSIPGPESSHMPQSN